MPEILHLFLLASLSSFLAITGGLVFLYNKKLGSVLEKNSIPFAAGVMITIAFLGLLPEAWEIIGEKAAWVVLATFFGAYLFEQLSFNIHHHSTEHDFHGHEDSKQPVGLVILGDSIHNFIDGISIGAAFFVNPGLALITAISTFLHEVPQEIGDFGILLKAGWGRTKVLVVNLFSASTTIIGAFVLYFFITEQTLVGYLLAIAAGFFLYLGTVDFLPHAHEGFSNKFRSLIPLALGVLTMILTLNAIPHTHDYNDEEHSYSEQGKEIFHEEHINNNEYEKDRDEIQQ